MGAPIRGPRSTLASRPLPIYNFPIRIPQSAIRNVTAAAGVLLLCASSARARQSEHAHPAPSSAVALDLAQRPVTLRTGIGSAHDPVSTSSKQAQAFYDQGLAYLHSYVWVEADPMPVRRVTGR